MRQFLPAVCLCFAACADLPPANDALDQARAVYVAVQADPLVTAYAPAELDLAGRTLSDAERMWRGYAYPDEVAHQAYLAEQRSRIARETARSRANEAETAKLAGQRRGDPTTGGTAPR